jgi:thiamine transport system substrate-binding protein
MYPATLARSELPAGFEQLIAPSPALLLDPQLVANKRKAWVEDWLEVMSK